MTLKEQYEMRQRQWDEFHRWESQQPPKGRTPEKMTIHVVSLDEGTWCTRPAECVDLGNGLFRLLATPDDPEDEHWELPPRSVVRCKTIQSTSGEYLLAVNADST
jgi:hypothetical protein